MPVYLEPLNGISYSEAMAESAVGARIDRVILSTFELWHPVMGAAPIRAVVDTEPLTATLEATAPRNPGETVDFIPSQLQIEYPEESENANSPTLTITVSNVSRLIKDVLDQIRASTDPEVLYGKWELIERIYASDDTTAPAKMPPFQLTLTKVRTQGAVTTLTAAYRDSANTAIPAITFTPEAYPGLLS